MLRFQISLGSGSDGKILTRLPLAVFEFLRHYVDRVKYLVIKLIQLKQS